MFWAAFPPSVPNLFCRRFQFLQNSKSKQKRISTQVGLRFRLQNKHQLRVDVLNIIQSCFFIFKPSFLSAGHFLVQILENYVHHRNDKNPKYNTCKHPANSTDSDRMVPFRSRTLRPDQRQHPDDKSKRGHQNRSQS